MSEKSINSERRNFLIGATSVVGAVGAVGLAVPFVGSWNLSAKALAAGLVEFFGPGIAPAA